MQFYPSSVSKILRGVIFLGFGIYILVYAEQYFALSPLARYALSFILIFFGCYRLYQGITTKKEK